MTAELLKLWARVSRCWCRDLPYLDHLTRGRHVRNTYAPRGNR